MSKSEAKATRRKFLKGGAIAAGVTAATMVMPHIAKAAPTVLKSSSCLG